MPQSRHWLACLRASPGAAKPAQARFLELELMHYEVQLRELAPHFMASARGHGHAHNYIANMFALLDQVWKFLRANPEIKREHNVFLYWNEEGKDLFGAEAGLPIEAGVRVFSRFEGSGNVVCSSTPGGTVAIATHIGPYAKLGGAHSAIREWCKANNRLLAGPNWELYGDWNDDPEQLQTDVFYLLK
jgi:effector-binding domain-containing protein